MDVTDISSHLDKLDGDVNKLEEVLKPILADLGEVASKLPLLDKAKLYVLATYAIENALFCKTILIPSAFMTLSNQRALRSCPAPSRNRRKTAPCLPGACSREAILSENQEAGGTSCRADPGC